MSRDTSVKHSIGTYAIEFGLTRDVLRRILAEAQVKPDGKRGGHPVYRLRNVYAALLQQQQPEAMNPHARLALARAIESEDRTRKVRGELVEADDMARLVARLAMVCARGLESAADVAERDVGLTKTQIQFLEAHFDRVRNELAAEVEALVDEDDNEHP